MGMTRDLKAKLEDNFSAELRLGRALQHLRNQVDSSTPRNVFLTNSDAQIVLVLLLQDVRIEGIRLRA
jgi:hypothetical protein